MIAGPVALYIWAIRFIVGIVLGLLFLLFCLWVWIFTTAFRLAAFYIEQRQAHRACP